MSRRHAIRGIPHRPHFDVNISGNNVARTIDVFESSFKKNGFQTTDFGFFHHKEGSVKIRYYEHIRKHPKASVWCFPSNESATKSEIETFAERVEKIIQAVSGIKVRRNDSLLYEKRYAVVNLPDDVWRWTEPPVLWFNNYFEDPVISYIWRKMQIDPKNHKKFFETFLTTTPEKRWTDKELDLLHYYHYGTIFWLAASRLVLNQLIKVIGITDGRKTRLKDGYLKFKLQTALGAFLTNLSSALDALAQIVNLMCLSERKKEEKVTFRKMTLSWIDDNAIWKEGTSRLRQIFRESDGNETFLCKKCSEMIDYRNIVVHRRLPPLVETKEKDYIVDGEPGKLVARAPDSTSLQSRSVAVHIPHFEADIDKGLAVIVISPSGRLFLPRIREGRLVYDYPIDRGDLNGEDVLLQFEKYYECVSFLIEKVYKALLDMKRHKN